jgi:hypothetical protein
MQVVHDTTLQGVRPFFGCNSEKRGEYFTHLNYNGSEFGRASSTVDTIESQPIFQLLLCKNYKNCPKGEEDYIHENMIDLIINTAAFHKIIDKVAKGSMDAKIDASTKAGDFVKYLFDAVYKGWVNLSDDVRQFYRTFLHVLVKTPGGWVQPSDVAQAAAMVPGDVRLNLTKVDPSNPASGILFATTLPKLPKTVRGFKFTNKAGGVVKVDFPGGVDKNLLEEIYNSVYNQNKVTINSIVHGDVQYVNCDTTLLQFDLDYVQFTKNVLLAHANSSSAKNAAASAAANANKDNFDDIFQSLTTGVTFVRKGADLFRVDGDTKKEVKLDEAQLQRELEDTKTSCHGTMVKGDCDFVFKCLLSGSPENLSRCLSKLRNEDMFKVAEREVEKMHPKVAKQLLETFGFRYRKETNGLVLPPSFNDWVQNILPRSVGQETRETILKNKQLMNYLNSVVTLIRRNPQIENNISTSGQSKESLNAGIKVFHQPTTHADRVALSARILEQGVLLSRPAVNMFPLGGLFQNVGMMPQMGMMGAQPFMLQSGGGNPQCVNANMLRNMFDVTYSEMERNGKELVEADKKRIEDSIKRVAHLEEQLVKILEDLKLFSKLNTTFYADRQSIGVEEVSLADVTGAKNVTDITSEAVANLKNCASQNVTEQSRLMSDLILQIQRSLVGTLMGNERNPLLERVHPGRM